MENPFCGKLIRSNNQRRCHCLLLGSVPLCTAKDFADQARWTAEYSKEWDSEDGSESLAELKRAGLIKLYLYDGFSLNDDAIIYMENRFKNGLSEVMDFISKFIP